jgi:hypothetical protein
MSQYYTIRDARNPRWANLEHNAIDLEVDFTDLPEEYLPYTATPTDVVEHSRELYSRALDGEFGEIAEYNGPLMWTPVNKTTIEVSTEGLVQLLLEKGILTDEEVDTILVEETVTVGFARTTIDGSNPVYNGVY